MRADRCGACCRRRSHDGALSGWPSCRLREAEAPRTPWLCRLACSGGGRSTTPQKAGLAGRGRLVLALASLRLGALASPRLRWRLERAALRTHQVELRWFDMVILLTIGANCATMAWESPLDEMLHPEGTWKSDFVSQHVESALLARQVWWLWGGALPFGGAATR